MSGRANCALAREASCAGQAAFCPAEKIPADWTPMLLLVPSATYRANVFAAVCLASITSVVLGVIGADTGSAHAATRIAAARNRERFMEISLVAAWGPCVPNGNICRSKAQGCLYRLRTSGSGIF